MQPFLMALMHFPQVIQTNALLSLPSALPDAFQAQFRRTFQVDYCLQRAFLNHCPTNLAVDSVFSQLHISLAIHDLSKHIPICKRRALRIMQSIRLFSSDLLPQFASGMDSIELEGECPSLGVLVVVFKDVDASHVLPLVDWFLDGGDVEEGEEGGLASPQVSFDRDDSGHTQTRPLKLNLIIRFILINQLKRCPRLLFSYAPPNTILQLKSLIFSPIFYYKEIWMQQGQKSAKSLTSMNGNEFAQLGACAIDEMAMLQNGEGCCFSRLLG